MTRAIARGGSPRRKRADTTPNTIVLQKDDASAVELHWKTEVVASIVRMPRIKAEQVDLGAFEAWLRSQSLGPAFSGVIVVVLQMIHALFDQNLQLRMRLMSRRPKPPSERLAALERQLSFVFMVPINNVAPTVQADPPAEGEQTAVGEKPPRRKPRPRAPIPDHIIRVISVNDVTGDDRICGTCQVPMVTMSRRAVETFELIVGRIIVQRRLDETVCCQHCDAIVCAKAPPSILDGGILGPTLVTEALCNKVLDGMPVERQARHFVRQGVPLSPSTLGRSISCALALLVPLAARVLLHVKQSEHVQFDSTGLRLLDREAPTGIFRDTLWVLIGDRRWVYFAPLKKGDSDAIEAVLEGAEASAFQCDGTSVTNFVEKKWHRCRPGCHAHARRRLVEAARTGDPRAMEGLRLFAKLFVVEQQATKEGLDPTQRQQRRQERSIPILEEMRKWVLKMAPTVEPKSTLGEGLTYLQRQWMRLNVFVLDGEIEITNNRSERELRPWTLGQHAWLFMGDQKHAEEWSAAFSLVQTALAQGVIPRAYLHAVIKRLIAGHSHTKLDELLPDAMLRAHPELADPLRAAHSAPRSTKSSDEVHAA